MLAHLMNVNHDLSDEARSRIDSARLHDLAFFIRKVSGASSELDEADVEMLAEIVAQGADQQVPVTKYYLVDALIERGRSRREAETLAATLFR